MTVFVTTLRGIVSGCGSLVLQKILSPATYPIDDEGIAAMADRYGL